MADPALLVVDMQRVFAQSPSPWASPDYARAAAGVERLLPAFEGRTVFTRYVAPLEPSGAWREYFELWPFALVPHDDPLFDLTEPFATAARNAPVETRASFGKWDDGTAAALGGPSEIVLVGVSTDCCVLSTALAAADAGVHVLVPEDACAGASSADHHRALDAMSLYGPLIEITTVDAVLAG